MSRYATPTPQRNLVKTTPSPPSPKYSHLGYQDSLVQARRVIADNERRKYDEQKARQKEEQVKQRRLLAERLMIQRQREEDANRTGEELGGQLLKSLRAEVSSRMEAQLKDEVRQRAESEKMTWYHEFEEFEKGKIKDHLQEELGPVVRSELTASLLPEVHEELKDELTPEVLKSLRAEHSQSVEDEVREQLRKDLAPSVIQRLREDNLRQVREQLEEENRQHVIDTLREQSKQQVIDQLRLEQHDIVLADLRLKLSSEATREETNIIETPSGGSLAGDTKSPPPAAEQPSSDQSIHDRPLDFPDTNGDAHEAGLVSRTLYPDLTDKAEQVSPNTDFTGDTINHEMHVLPEENLVGTAHEFKLKSAERGSIAELDSRNATQISQQNGLSPASEAVGTLGANHGILPTTDSYQTQSHDDGFDEADFETAPEQKDFRFNPDVHELKFSSPASQSHTGEKRSLSLTDRQSEDAQPPAKRKRISESVSEDGEGSVSAGDDEHGEIMKSKTPGSKNEAGAIVDLNEVSDEEISMTNDRSDSNSEFYEEDNGCEEGEGMEEVDQGAPSVADKAALKKQRQHLQNKRNIHQLLEGEEEVSREDASDGQLDYESGSLSGSISGSGDDGDGRYRYDYTSDEMEEGEEEGEDEDEDEDAQDEASLFKFSNTQETAIELDDD